MTAGPGKTITGEQFREAQRKLPLLPLMNELGLGEYAQNGARCPFKPTEHSSFSIFQDNSGNWLWKCDSGCGTGDALALLMKHYGMKPYPAAERYVELAGVANGNGASVKTSAQSSTSDKPETTSGFSRERANEQSHKPAQLQLVAANGKAKDNIAQGNAVLCPDVEPWPQPVEGVAVLDAIADSFERYVVLPEGAPQTLALFCAHTHCYQLFTCSPRLSITSPDRGCGKTTLRDVVKEFVRRPFSCENATTATLFRLIDRFAPTLLLDECDAWLRNNEELRGVLNSGHRNGGCLPRCEGDSHTLRVFPTYAPAVLCGIGNLPGTLYDRSIVVRLTRAKPGEIRARFDSRNVTHERDLNRKLARWIADNRERIATCDPILPEGAWNRLADNWRPLFAIAQCLAGDWPKRCANAFAQLSSRNFETESYRVMVLADIETMVREAIEQGEEWLPSGEIIKLLLAIPERPWNEANRGKEINQSWLARKLDPIKSKQFRDESGKQARGYKVTELQDAIERFVSQLVTSG